MIGKTSARLSRAYNRESDLGNLFADLHRKEGNAQIGLYPSGGIPKGLRRWDVTIQELLDVWPFLDTVQTVKISGALLTEVIEQGLSLDRGIMQVSGIEVAYDLERPVGSRVLEIIVGNKPLKDTDYYTLATGSYIVNGGDNYPQFRDLEIVALGRPFSRFF